WDAKASLMDIGRSMVSHQFECMKTCADADLHQLSGRNLTGLNPFDDHVQSRVDLPAGRIELPIALKHVPRLTEVRDSTREVKRSGVGEKVEKPFYAFYCARTGLHARRSKLGSSHT